MHIELTPAMQVDYVITYNLNGRQTLVALGKLMNIIGQSLRELSTNLAQFMESLGCSSDGYNTLTDERGWLKGIAV